MATERKAVVLFSGGLDSTTVVAMARARGFTIYALTIDYGQRHAVEIEVATRIAARIKVARHVVLPIDLSRFGGSALTGDIPVPKGREIADMGADIPVTYVPARNTIFLSVALGWAEVLGALDIFIGVNAMDYSGYPDCRPHFIGAFEMLANLATKVGVEGQRIVIHAPLIDLSKSEIIRKGLDLGVDYAATFSCYDPSSDGRACGACDACVLRAKGFREAGLEDPALSA